MPQTWTTTILMQGVRVRVSGSFSHVMKAVRANWPTASKTLRKALPGTIHHFQKHIKTG